MNTSSVVLAMLVLTAAAGLPQSSRAQERQGQKLGPVERSTPQTIIDNAELVLCITAAIGEEYAKCVLKYPKAPPMFCLGYIASLPNHLDNTVDAAIECLDREIGPDHF